MHFRSNNWVLTSLAIICILFSIDVQSQVATGSFTFTSQADVDEFLINNPNVTSIDGDLNLYMPAFGSSESPITDLSGMQGITSISGGLHLEIDDDYFGLHNLVSIGEALYIIMKPTSNLNTFDVLQEAKTIVLDFSVAYGVYNLSNVFPSIASVEESIYILDAAFAQISFDGFHALTNAQGVFINSLEYPTIMDYFNAFDQLVSCQLLQFDNCIIHDFAGGFQNLQSVDVYLLFEVATNSLGYPDFAQLESCPRIDFFGGGDNILPLNFPSLTQTDTLTVQGAFGGIHLSLLESLDFLSLKVVGTLTSALSYVDAPLLEVVSGTFLLSDLGISDLSSFSSLDSLPGVIDISHCPNLSDCAITAMCERLSVDLTNVFLYNNAPGCNTVDEVLNACSVSLSYVTGNVYADMNCDGVWNAGDFVIPNGIIQVENGLPVGASYHDGSYYVPLPDSDTIEIHAMVPFGFLDGPEYTLTTTNLTEVYSNYDFPLCPNLNFHDVRVYSYGSTPRPGFSHSYFVSVSNEAMPVEDVFLTFDFSGMPGATITSATGTISGNTVSWTVVDLDFLESSYFYVDVYVDPSTPLGTVYIPVVSATLLSAIADDDPSDNVFSFEQTVIGSYDPNDKTVNRTAIDVAELSPDEGEWLDYTIRFQNTGTAEAITVLVEDVIADNLDLSTFQQLDASHTFDLSFDENRKVEWLFNNIMLSDSNTNEPESHGFIHFRIKTIAGLGVADVVGNSVAIYFDFNEPIITNTATTIFYECTQIAEITGVADVCEGSDALLNANGNWDDYLWTIDGNVVGTTNELMMDNLSAGQQTISLHVSDTYCSEDADFVLDVNAIPVTPVITQSGNTLTASGNGIFSWTLNGETIADNDNSIEITQSGVYGVNVMETMCVSEISSASFEYVGVNDSYASSQLVCYPNPARDVLFVELPESWTGHNQITMTDLLGKVVMSLNSAKNRLSLDVASLASGTYQIVVIDENDSQVVTKPIFVE